jgi:hypothetical protein
MQGNVTRCNASQGEDKRPVSGGQKKELLTLLSGILSDRSTRKSNKEKPRPKPEPLPKGQKDEDLQSARGRGVLRYH